MLGRLKEFASARGGNGDPTGFRESWTNLRRRRRSLKWNLHGPLQSICEQPTQGLGETFAFPLFWHAGSLLEMEMEPGKAISLFPRIPCLPPLLPGCSTRTASTFGRDPPARPPLPETGCLAAFLDLPSQDPRLCSWQRSRLGAAGSPPPPSPLLPLLRLRAAGAGKAQTPAPPPPPPRVPRSWRASNGPPAHPSDGRE